MAYKFNPFIGNFDIDTTNPGDITAVNAGTGLTGGGTSGSVTLSLDTSYTNGLYLQKAPTSNTDNLITQQSATDVTFLSLDPNDADAKKFNWNLWTATQAGRDNVGINWGYNQASGGGPSDSADNAFYIQMETHYNPGGDPLMEYHLNAYTADGLTSKRPFHINVYKDDLYTEWSFYLDTMSWLSRSNGFQGLRLDLGTNAATSQWIMSVPPIVRVDSTSALLVQNAAASVNTMVVDTTNGTTTIRGGTNALQITNGTNTYLNFDATLGRMGIGSTLNTSTLSITNNADVVGLRILPNGTQTASLFEVYDSTRARVFVNASYTLQIANAAGTKSFGIYDDGNGHIDSNSGGESLIFSNWTALQLAGWVFYASGSTDTTTRLSITSPSAASIPLTIVGASSQTANLSEWKDSTSTIGSYIAGDSINFSFGQATKGRIYSNLDTIGTTDLTFKRQTNSYQNIIHFLTGANEYAQMGYQGSSDNFSWLSARNDTALLFSVASTPVLGLYPSGLAGYSVLISPQNSGQVGEVIKAKSGQTANLTEWQNSSGTKMTWIQEDGQIVYSNIGTSLVDGYAGLEITKYHVGTNLGADWYGIYDLLFTAVAQTGTVYGQKVLVSIGKDTAGGTPGATGMAFQVSPQHTAGTFDYMQGIQGYVTSGANGGTVSNVYGIYSLTQLTHTQTWTNTAGFITVLSQSAGTIQNYWGYYVSTANRSAGTLTNEYGVYIEDINDGSTLNYAIYTNAGISSFGDHVKIRTDSKLLYFGTGDDATITYDGTDMIIDPQLVGSGMLSILSGIRLEAKSGTTGAGDVWHDTTQKALQTYVDSVEQTLTGVVFTQTATTNINTSAAETTLTNTGVGTLTLPANFFVTGKTIRVKATCFASTTGTPTVRIKIKLGSVIMLDTTAIAVDAALTNNLIDIEGIITCYTTGGTGTFWSQGRADIKPGAATGINFWQMVNTGTVAVDTTASQAVDVTFQWGTSSASNTVTCTNLVVEVIN